LTESLEALDSFPNAGKRVPGKGKKVAELAGGTVGVCFGRFPASPLSLSSNPFLCIHARSIGLCIRAAMVEDDGFAILHCVANLQCVQFCAFCCSKLQCVAVS